MKKLCMVVQDPAVKGGIAAVVNGYYGSELEKKYDVTYVQSYRDGTKVQKLNKALVAYYQFAKNLITNKPDIVHLHTSFGASFYRQIPFIYMAQFCAVPVINHIHGPEFDKFFHKASDRKKSLIKRIYGKCTYLITLSQEWRENFLEIVSEDKICVIDNYSICANQLNWNYRNPKQILFLGAINQRKGCFDMPEIVKKVSEIDPDVIFVIAGDGELTELRDKMETQSLLSYCEFPGWIRADQKDSKLRNSSIFFLPSYNEGMPMAILDAMGYSLPIVSTTVGGIPQIVKDGFNGFLHCPGDTEGMAGSLLTLLSNSHICRQMGEESLKMVKDSYTLEIHLQKLFDLYEAAMDSAK